MPSGEGLISTGQAALAHESGAIGVLSVPLECEGRPIGVLTLERNSGLPFDAHDTNTTRVIGVLLGPVLALKRDNERSMLVRGRDAAQQGMRALFGPRHSGVKLMAMLACTALLLVTLVKVDYRVSAKTLVEGSVQRASAAPFEGFIAQAHVQAGDVVRAGQVMARLDDKDLLVEQGRWSAEREQYLRKLRQAQANHELANSNVLRAQFDQAEAQLQLIQQKLAKTQLLAPFDGVVVSGDLRQLIGTPVEQGKVLFEIAPLDAFRVVLQVDEREIAQLAQGQQGELVLSGIPGERFKFTVKQVTPVAVAQEGHNFFRVEAQMDGGLHRLRPGMEGVGKVKAGRQSLIWIWTHSLVDWLKLSLWTWLP
jgi:RND family efflux transporter MFP subunit